jgi:hypothetical protein
MGGVAMKLKQCLIIIGTFWPIAAFSAGDSFYTGNRLFGYCEEKSLSCTDYIAGIVDTLMVMNVVTQNKMICPPNNIELGQAVDVTVNYLRAHPEKRQVSAASMAFVALTRAFPCNK